MALNCKTGPEAIEWLTAKAAPKGFALNRFATKDDGIRFVKELYDLGASKVFVPESDIRKHAQAVREIGGESSDSLAVLLPMDEVKRKAILAFCNDEARKEGLEEGKPEDLIVDGSFVFLWWD